MADLQRGIDNNAIRELRDVVKDLNKTIKESVSSNKKFSFVIGAFALVQIFFALSQLAVASLTATTYRGPIILIFIVTIGGMAYFLEKVFDKAEKL